MADQRRPHDDGTAFPNPAPPPAGWPRRGWRDRWARFVTSPRAQRPISRVLRRLAPVLQARGRVVVSRHADVVDVLTRDVDFTIAEVNGARMERWSGPFFLGMDRGERYERESSALREAVRAEDLERVRALVSGAAAELVDGARPAGRLDVVGGLSRVVAYRVVADYLGAPGPDQASTMRWMRALFDVLFLDGGRRAQAAATLTVAEQRPYMELLIAGRRAAVKSGAPTPDDVLTRLVALGAAHAWLDDDSVRRNLNGLIIGALDTTSKAVAHVVDELLRRPDALAGARQAAVAGDIDSVRGFAWEALRFLPFGVVLQRHCAADTVLGPNATAVRKGSTVIVSTLSAMFDPSAFPAPGTFQADRPLDRYLPFGYGLHTCFGAAINAVQIPEVVAAVLRLPGLRRAPGSLGRLVYDGPFPDRLVVEFDPA